EFLAWLTDPKQNGGGAIIDFGCYGANLATWFMKGQSPLTVTAVTQQLKPDIYPHVDDEATIILTYPQTQVIIQASWNWPFGRKDATVYGTRGYAVAEDKHHLRARLDNDKETTQTFADRVPPFQDPFSFFAALVDRKITLDANDLSAPANNLVVMKIL